MTLELLNIVVKTLINALNGWSKKYKQLLEQRSYYQFYNLVDLNQSKIQ